MTHDPDRDRRITAAVTEILADVLDRHIARPVAIARGVQRIVAIVNDCTAPVIRNYAAMLIEMDVLGNGRDAAALVARRYARDRHDPRECHAIAQHLRRLRKRRNKEKRTCAFAGAGGE